MKKVLFATTALVASAGVASAQDLGISISGFAEIGIAGGSGFPDVATGSGPITDPVDRNKTRLHNDIGIQIDAVGETDNGISFGMSFEIDDSNGNDRVNGTPGFDNEFAFISSGPVTFTMGEINGAYDQRVDEASWGGSLTDDHTAHGGFNTTNGADGAYDNQIARLDYDMGAFGASISVEQDDSANDLNPIWGIGVSYGLELTGVDLDFGAGFMSHDENNGRVVAGAQPFLGIESAWGLSVGAGFDNGLKLAANYESISIDEAKQATVTGDAERWTIGAGYDFNNLSVEANYGQTNFDSADNIDGFGLAAQYDLGGGLQAQAGYGNTNVPSAVGDDVETWSLGLSMSF
ncbi:porin [Rhodosalinus sp. FB01]|uniref:porin n=1 Tax=Rhodosalinus sp. FB01 TaxID=3239194 RepID=UPI003526A7E2